MRFSFRLRSLRMRESNFHFLFGGTQETASKFHGLENESRRAGNSSAIRLGHIAYYSERRKFKRSCFCEDFNLL
jgi:hypothetical protein